MDSFEIILVLAVSGFLLLAAEVFVPGLVLGSLGGIALIGSVAVAYSAYGLITGTFILAAVVVLTVIGFTIWMNAFPKTAIGRRILLARTLVPGDGLPVSSLLGLEGTALTPLRPAGTALIDGRKIDVVTEGELIEAGAAITIIRQEGIRTLVRKSARSIAVAE